MDDQNIQDPRFPSSGDTAPQAVGTIESAEDAGTASLSPETEIEAPKRRKFHIPRWLFDRENVARAVWALGPWCTYLMVEILNDNDPFTSLTPEQVTLNLVWYYLIFWVVRMLLGRKNAASAVSASACFAFGLANHYVLTFRGRVIFPCDLLSIRTGINVMSDFDFTPDRQIWIAAAILAGYLLAVLFARLIFRRRGRQRLRRAAVLSSCAVIAVYLYVFFFTGALPAIGIYAQQWKTQANGFVLNFMAALRYSFVSRPEGYSAGAAQAIADEFESAPDAPAAEPPENLIVIMNESFADLTAAYPDLQLTDDPLAFYHSLTENTVKGTMVSPVTGGGTANVEFEYLTGDSLAFLPSSTVAYQLYLYDGAPSLVSQAKALGYHATAFHPYLASGWNRTSVYPWLGFDKSIFLEDLPQPASEDLIRQYVSDAADYRRLYSWTDEQDGPTFLFNVTMQNHSGYAQGWNNLEHTVELSQQPTAVTTQFFSLMKESDDAIRQLIEHYSASDERTMVVFFGDHQPPLGNDFYRKLAGKNLDDRDTGEVMQQYGVPFFIWANYDIPERQNVLISSNFLGTLTCQLAGFPMTGWQKLHAALMEQLPVATTVGFVTADGTVYGSESALPEETAALYEKYRIMAYNHLLDEKHHPENFYG